MELISKPEDWAVELYEDTLFNGDYKLSDYCIVEEYDNGYILFHTVTWTILYLTKEEFENRFNSTFLLANKIIVNKNIDETDIAEKAYVNRAYIDIKDKFKNINNFVILTTNECNANCPYCYEVLKKGKMSKETADNLLDFIEKRHNGKVTITWFGGEPLMNTDIMDYITTKLVEKEIKYSTSIISNTFNFTEDIIEKAVNLWKINHLQVTLDGPSEYYNKIKNFDYNGDSFDFVLNNVQNILKKTKIGISIRINVSDENIDMVDELFSVLKDRFNDYMKTRIKFDIHEVFQMYDEPNTEKRNEFFLRLNELQNKYSNDPKKNIILKKQLIHCFTDRCSCAVVEPNGIIHNCEHTTPSNIIGTLKDGITRMDYIEKATQKDGENNAMCKEFKCKLLPVCDHYQFCEDSGPCKSKELSDLKNEIYRRKLIRTYEYYKSKKGDK